MSKIAIIGGGNLGASIADGLLASHFVEAKDLTITRRQVKALERFAAQGCRVTPNNQEAISQSDIIIICLKPYQVKGFLQEFASSFTSKHVVISTVSGFSLREMEEWLNHSILFRAMPNTAIAIRQSMTCISYWSAEEQSIRLVEELFRTVGETTVIDDKLMDAATVLGACGTAFAMRFIRANIQGGVEIGFDVATASLIAAQTIKGAAQLLLEKKTHPEQEIDKVATPKGCTIAGLNEMEHQGFSSSLIKGLKASFEQIQRF